MLHLTQPVCSGAPYVKFLPGFRRLFPGMDPVPLVASVLFYTPVVRDLVSWCGVRQVRLATFHRTVLHRCFPLHPETFILRPGQLMWRAPGAIHSDRSAQWSC